LTVAKLKKDVQSWFESLFCSCCSTHARQSYVVCHVTGSDRLADPDRHGHWTDMLHWQRSERTQNWSWDHGTDCVMVD